MIADVSKPTIQSMTVDELRQRWAELWREAGEIQAELRQREESEHAAVHAGLHAEYAQKIAAAEWDQVMAEGLANEQRIAQDRAIHRDRMAGRSREGAI